MKPEPNSKDDSRTSKVRKAAASYPATVDLAPIADQDALPEHDEPPLELQLNHARLLLQIDPRAPEQRLEERRKTMNPERFTI